ELLTTVGDVDDFVRRPFAEAVVEGGEIGSGIIGCAVLFLDDGVNRHPLAITLDEKGVFFFGYGTIGKNTGGPLTLASNAFRTQVFNNRIEPWIVKRLSKCRIETDTEPTIYCLELRVGEANHLAPDGEVLFVTR